MGVDVGEERKGFDVVVMARDRAVLESRGHLSLQEVGELIDERRPEVVCIDGPPRPALSGKSRKVERDLLAMGIGIFAVPDDLADRPFYRWMQFSLTLFEEIAAEYPLRTTFPLSGGAVEVFPHASAGVLARRLPGRAETKSAFRRAVLEENGVETTRLSNLDRVDAALAALTGRVAIDGVGCFVGDPDEGCILLPSSSPPSWLRKPFVPEETALGSKEAGSCLCGCGCGALVRHRFLPGHDARLKSELLRRHRAGDADATERLRALGWIPDVRA